MNLPTIGIYGGGAWGLSLGAIFHEQQRLTALYTSYADTLSSVRDKGRSDRIPYRVFPSDFPITNETAAPLRAEILLIASTLKRLPEHLAHIANSAYAGQHLVLCCKGQEVSSGKFPHHIAEEHFAQDNIYLLSGPSFAKDLAQGKAIAVSLAGENISQTQQLASTLSSKHFRLYASNDPMGVAIGGAYKNVFAIAAGIGSALDIGPSASAALITRGLVELKTLCESLGGRPSTVMGLSGLGDFILTCHSTESRNFRLGIAMGQGMSAEKAAQQIGAVTEGYYTAKSIPQICQRHGLDLPILEMVYRILFQGLTPEAAMHHLLSRPGGKVE